MSLSSGRNRTKCLSLWIASCRQDFHDSFGGRRGFNSRPAIGEKLVAESILTHYSHRMDLSLKSLEQAVSIRRQMDALHKRLASIFGTASSGLRARGGRRGMSAAARARISAAMRARWAKRKAGTATAKRKGGISAAGRKRLSQIMKARWAARKRAAGKK